MLKLLIDAEDYTNFPVGKIVEINGRKYKVAELPTCYTMIRSKGFDRFATGGDMFLVKFTRPLSIQLDISNHQ